MFDYTACQTCGTLWDDGLYCPVCEQVWKRGKRTTATDLDSLLCEKCDKWVHLACDSITPQQLTILRRPDFRYCCPVCRLSDERMTATWTDQLDRIEFLIKDKQRKEEEKKRRALLSQDYLTTLYPPFSPSLVPVFSAGQPNPSLLSSVFSVHLPSHRVAHLHGLSLLEQVELVKNQVRRVQLKRRRERRAYLVQEKRRAMEERKGIEGRGSVWLHNDEDDGEVGMDEEVTEEKKRRVKELLSLCFPLIPLPTSCNVQHLPLLSTSLTLHWSW
jgi:hypothetical protein